MPRVWGWCLFLGIVVVEVEMFGVVLVLGSGLASVVVLVLVVRQVGVLELVEEFLGFVAQVGIVVGLFVVWVLVLTDLFG